jgi:hypothetical protein
MVVRAGWIGFALRPRTSKRRLTTKKFECGVVGRGKCVLPVSAVCFGSASLIARLIEAREALLERTRHFDTVPVTVRPIAQLAIASARTMPPDEQYPWHPMRKLARTVRHSPKRNLSVEDPAFGLSLLAPASQQQLQTL